MGVRDNSRHNTVMKLNSCLTDCDGLMPDEHDPFYSETNQMHLENAVKQLRDGKGMPHELIEDGHIYKVR